MNEWKFLIDTEIETRKDLICFLRNDIIEYLSKNLNLKLCSAILECKIDDNLQGFIKNLFETKYTIHKGTKCHKKTCFICLTSIGNSNHVECKTCDQPIYHIDCAEVWFENNLFTCLNCKL